MNSTSNHVHIQTSFNFYGSEEKAKGAILYSYTRHINGFSAILDEEEAIELASKEENISFHASSFLCFVPLLTFRHFLIFTVENPEVKSIFLNKGRKLHTTRSWEFLGLERDGRTLAGSLWQKAKFGKDVIIGNLDTGKSSLSSRVLFHPPIFLVVHINLSFLNVN